MGYTFTFFVGVILVDYKSTKNYTKNTFTLIPAMISYQSKQTFKNSRYRISIQWIKNHWGMKTC